MLTQGQLKEIFAEYNFRPLKRLGENYLIDANIKDKIIAAADVKRSDTILEIGPGLGALTMDLAAAGARIYAVDKDKKSLSILKELAGDDYPNLKLLNADILTFDLKSIKGKSKVKVIGNLPYYITTPIIEYLIENRRRIEWALITVQREVANRLLAPAGSEDYASISCYVQYHTRPEYIHTIRRTSFYPAPEVDSSLIRLEMLPAPSVKVKDEGLLFKIIRGAFNQRRKAILNSLSRKDALNMPKEELATTLAGAGIGPNARPEDLTLQQFASIANALG